MKILIHIDSNSELITYEAIALAFLLASFDHHIQLKFGGHSKAVLTDDKSRLYGMVQSLPLYDMPMAWADFENFDGIDEAVQAMLIKDFANAPQDFDSVLDF